MPPDLLVFVPRPYRTVHFLSFLSTRYQYRYRSKIKKEHRPIECRASALSSSWPFVALPQ